MPGLNCAENIRIKPPDQLGDSPSRPWIVRSMNIPGHHLQGPVPMPERMHSKAMNEAINHQHHRQQDSASHPLPTDKKPRSKKQHGQKQIWNQQDEH